MKRAINLLVAEDSEDDASIVIRMLERGGFEARYERVETAATMEAALRRQSWDAVISDYNMPGFGGMDALRVLRSTGLDIPFILISGFVGEEIAVDALKAGVGDYVLKKNLSRLPLVLERELREAAIRAEYRRIQRDLVESEQRYRQMFSANPHPMWVFDPETLRFLSVNDAAVAHYGWSREEFLALKISDIRLPGEVQRLRHQISQEKHQEVVEADVWKHRKKDGTILDVEITSHVINFSGRPAQVVLAHDITEHKRVEQDLQRFQFAMDMSIDSIYLTDVESMRFVYANDVACRRLGYSRDQLFRMGPQDVLGADREQIRGGFDAVIAAGEKGLRSENRFVRSDRSKGWTEIHYRAVLVDGRWLIVTIGRDITERRKAERRIARLNRVYAMLSGINAAIVRIRDRTELFQEACRIVVEAGRLALAYVCVVDPVEQRLKPVASAGADAGFLEGMQERMSLRDGAPEGFGPPATAVRERRAVFVNDTESDSRIRHKKAYAERGIRSVAALPLFVSGEPAGVLALHAAEIGFFDEEEIKLLTELAGDIGFALDHIEKASRLDYLAYYDQLTGLANRRLFVERLNQTMRATSLAGDKMALVLIDVEHLTTVNESLGRQAGDALLLQLAERLARSAGPEELARIGADVFAIIQLAVKGKSEVTRRIEKIWDDCFGKSFRLADSEIRISAKAGAAMFPGDGADAETLLRNAEAALRRAKETGERHVFHALEMTAKTGEKLTLENSLRQALEKDEFVLHYQPKVDLITRRIVGVEALIRWQNPELGLVPPGHFIPLMEETGLILDVGAWALAKAVSDHSRWMELGLPAPRVAVNVSAIQLRRRDFVATVEQALKRGSVPPGIDLEITESLIMEDIQGNIEKLKALRGFGLSIAIDDFGTGYSSLGYLAKLPLQALKIDRSFIITMLNDRNTMTLVQTIISLAHSLRLKMIAEGVDEEEQAKMLGVLRCDEMQGYLFSRPVPFDQLTTLLLQEIKT